MEFRLRHPEGEVLTFGRGGLGQLGHVFDKLGPNVSDQLLPRHMRGTRAVRHVSAGASYTTLRYEGGDYRSYSLEDLQGRSDSVDLEGDPEEAVAEEDWGTEWGK